MRTTTRTGCRVENGRHELDNGLWDPGPLILGHWEGTRDPVLTIDYKTDYQVVIKCLLLFVWVLFTSPIKYFGFN